MMVMHVTAVSGILLGILMDAVVSSNPEFNKISSLKPTISSRLVSSHKAKKYDLFNDEELKKLLPLPLSKYYQTDRNLQTFGSQLAPENKISSIPHDLMDSRILYFRMPVSSPFIYFSNFDEQPQYPAFTPYNVASAASSFSINPLHLSIPFTSNGKPSHVYKFPQTDFEYDKSTTKPKITSTTKPFTHLNKGPYPFNGKPADIYLLQDSFNSFFENSLNNFYP